MKCCSFIVAATFATLVTAFALGAPVRIAVFGGAESIGASAEAAKAVWRQAMDCTWDDFGVKGAGFVAGREAGHEVSAQLMRAFKLKKAYDMFVFWSSADDVQRDVNRGGEVEKGLCEAIDLVRTNAPHGQLVLFTPTQRPLKPELQMSIEGLCATLVRVSSAKNVSVLDFGRDIPFPKSGGTRFFMPDCLSLSADGYRFVASYQSKYLKYIHSVGWGVEPSLLQDKDELKRTLRRTQALHDAKWGVFNHYLGHGIKTADEWKSKVESFDVRKVADQLEACGARFYFLTLMQGRRWMCAPNETYDSIAGTRPGEACSTRDLPQELADELGKRGIDLYLYYTGDGPYMDREIGSRFGFTEPRFLGVTRPFVEKWASVLEELAVRYGTRVKGWWIDGCYADFLGYTDDLLGLYERAVRKGNADAAIAINNGVFEFYGRYSRHADFTAGEFNDFYCVPSGRIIQGAQAFALIPLGAWQEDGKGPGWGCGGCKRSADYVANYVNLVNANGGVVAIDVHVEPDGTWATEQMAVLKAVGQRTGTAAHPLRLAVFGGSFSVIGPSKVAKAEWCRRKSLVYDDYGVGGAGFVAGGPGGTNGIPVQIDRALSSGKAYDAFLLWASTNDIGKDIARQNAGIEACVRKIRAACPKAKVLFFTSMPVPLSPRQANLGVYADAQAETCRRLGVPVLEQHRLVRFPLEDTAGFFWNDRLHPNEKGYGVVKDVQAAFLAETL